MKSGDWLLHLTECIANYNQCPLITLTPGDVPSEPQVNEVGVRRYFKLASSWNAILLIKEADIIPARRSVSDLARNGLVSS